MNWAANCLIKQALGRMVGGALGGTLMPGMGQRAEMQASGVTPSPLSASQNSGAGATGYHLLGGGSSGAAGADAGVPGGASSFLGDAASTMLDLWAYSKAFGGGGKPAANGPTKPNISGKPGVSGRPGIPASTGAAGRGGAAAGRGAVGRSGAAAAGRGLASTVGRRGIAGTLGNVGSKVLGVGSKFLGPVGWAYTGGSIAADLWNESLDRQEEATRQQMQQTSNAAVSGRNAEILAGKHDWRAKTPQQQQQLAAQKERLRRQSY